jgi:putative spermidine/putrescine transport system ATP-binding protein
MSELQLTALNIAYANKGAAAVHGLNLNVPSGQLVSLLGPSGCGKTTTLRAVAGLLPLRSGSIVLGGKDIGVLPAHQRDLGLVFQSYALFPHLSAFDNVAFGLRLRKVDAAALKQRTEEALAAVGLADFAGRLPAQLSGGQQQRVALARALVIRPRLLLLDEPLSNLDASLRVAMRAEVRRLQRAHRTTMLYVTHDQDEALALSDRIVVMREGRIEQDAVPREVFERPATPFVASFMGYENLLPVQAGAWPGLAAGVTHLAWRPARVEVTAARSSGVGGAFDARVVGRAPPDAASASVSPAAGAFGHEGTVLARSYLGETTQYLVQTALGPIKGEAGAHAPWQEGDAVAVVLDPANAAHIGGSKPA